MLTSINIYSYTLLVMNTIKKNEPTNLDTEVLTKSPTNLGS